MNSENIISLKDFIKTYVDALPARAKFQARDIQRAYSDYTWNESKKQRKPLYKNPYSDSIQRNLRRRRAERNDVNYYNKAKSIWWKADHVATGEDTKVWP